MSNLTTSPVRQTTRTHRTQIVAEAVVSAYIHEIAPIDHHRHRVRSHHRATESPPRATADSRSVPHHGSRTHAPRRRAALQPAT